MMIKSIFIIVLILLTACADSQGIEHPTTESKVLNEFISQTPVQYIDLDEIQTTHIEVNKSDIIYDLQSDESEPIISDIRHFVNTDHSYYVYSWAQRVIYQIGKDGTKHGQLTKAGRGPGEHGILSSLTMNSESIFIADEENARINIYDHDFDYQKTVPRILARDVAVNENLLLTTQLNYQGLTDSGLVKIAALDAPQKAVKYIMPKIVPDGYQPFIYNSVDIAVNNHNQIAASYSPLPWIFLFNENQELEHTLLFQDSRFDSLNTVPLNIRKPNPNNKDGVGGANLLQRFVLMDNGDLFILNNVIEHLIKNEDGSYEHAGRYKVIYPGTDRTFWVDQLIPLKDGKMVASNWYYLFEFELPDK